MMININYYMKNINNNQNKKINVQYLLNNLSKINNNKIIIKK